MPDRTMRERYAMMVRCAQSARRKVGDRGRDAVGEESHTFAVATVFLFLGVCGFAASVIEGQEVERKVFEFQLCLEFWGEPFVKGVR
jgi:hypothetical protein